MLIRCASLVGHLWFNIDPKNKKIKNKITSNKYKIEFENKKAHEEIQNKCCISFKPCLSSLYNNWNITNIFYSHKFLQVFLRSKIALNTLTIIIKYWKSNIEKLHSSSYINQTSKILTQITNKLKVEISGWGRRSHQLEKEEAWGRRKEWPSRVRQARGRGLVARVNEGEGLGTSRWEGKACCV